MNSIKTFEDLYIFGLSITESCDIIELLRNSNEITERYQEGFIKLFCALGIVFPKEYVISTGNFSNKQNTPIDDFRKFMRSSIIGGGDKSDITMITKKNKCSECNIYVNLYNFPIGQLNCNICMNRPISKEPDIIVITYKNIQHLSIDGFDYANLFLLIRQYEYTKIKICTVTRSKSEYEHMLKNIHRSSEYLQTDLDLTKYQKSVFDWDDIQIFHQQFTNTFTVELLSKLNEIILEKSLITISLLPHQHYSVHKTLELFSENSDNVLWGHVPRSGKSYIMAGTVYEDSKNFEECNYLYVSTAPATLLQIKDMLNSTIWFEDFGIHHIQLKKKPVLKRKNIFLVSKQFLQSKGTKSNSKYELISWLKDMSFRIRFLDEAHFGGSTDLATHILQTYGFRSLTVFITATYQKPKSTYMIPLNRQITWTLEDISLMKKYDEDSPYRDIIEQRHPDIQKSLFLYQKQFMIEQYNKYPTFHLLIPTTTQLLRTQIEITDDSPYYTNYGFSLQSIFGLVQIPVINDGGDTIGMNIEPTFINPEYVEKIINMMFGFSKTYPLPDNHSFLSRINHMSSQDKSRVYNKKNCLTMLCFLPCEFNNIPIDKLSIAFKNMLETTGISERFEIIILNDIDSENQLPTIENGRNRAIESRKEGVIVLSGKKCSMGISIKHCDIVFILNGLKAYDMLFQMMFRSLTEDDGKKNGYVVDLHIQRSIDVLMEYALSIKPSEDPKNTLLYMMENKIILLNADEWMPTYLKVFDKTNAINDLISDVYKIWESDPLRNIPTLLRHMKKEFGNMDVSSQLQKQFNSIFLDNTKKIKNNKENVYEGEGVDISSGVEKKTKKNNNGIEEEVAPEIIEEVENKVDIYEIMLKIIPVLCILTIQHGSNNFREMLAHIYRTPELHLILDDCINFLCKNKIDIRKCILYIIKMYEDNLEDNVIVNQTIRKIKDMFILNKKDNRKLSELIDLYLVPTDTEKTKNAEVSTPMDLRQEMLNTIPIDFWTIPRKVLEPCSGKGGFLMDIVDKFMNGLKEVIIDEEERYRTIVEECLYWCDINKLNIFICKTLLDPDNKYNLKYNEGDTLELNIKKKWNIEGFDLVVGNPPYENINASGDNKLYLEFTTYSISQLVLSGILLFITPTNIIDYLLCVSKNRMYIKSLYNILYIAINTPKKYFSIGSTFCYFLLYNEDYYGRTVIKYLDIIEKETTISLVKSMKLPCRLNPIDLSILQKITSNTHNYNLLDFTFNKTTQRIRKHHINSGKISTVPTNVFKYEIIESVNKTYPDGKVYYYDKLDNDILHKKIVFSKKGYLMPFISDKKNRTFCDNFKYILCNDDNMLNLFMSKIIDYLIFQFSKNGFDRIDVLYILKKIDNYDNIYNSYHLTDEEITVICGKPVITVEVQKQVDPLNLQDLKITELKNIARTEKIKGFSKYTTKTKNELIELIEKQRSRHRTERNLEQIIRN